MNKDRLIKMAKAIDDGTAKTFSVSSWTREEIVENLFDDGYTNQVIIDYEADLAMGLVDIEELEEDIMVVFLLPEQSLEQKKRIEWVTNKLNHKPLVAGRYMSISEHDNLVCEEYEVEFNNRRLKPVKGRW